MEKIFTFLFAGLIAMNVFADQTATVILRAGNVWGDGTGYQMLLDADATAYGTIIPVQGPLTNGGDVSDEVYAEFEYKIPGEADGKLDTENIVFNSSVSIEIPAGTYDFCITNPSPGEKMWIAADNGSIGGREDDFVFEADKIYDFSVAMYGGNDGIALTITDKFQGVENTTVNTKAVKVIRDGKLFIERGDKTFNVIGTQVK